jgi:hypothetical protein
LLADDDLKHAIPLAARLFPPDASMEMLGQFEHDDTSPVTCQQVPPYSDVGPVTRRSAACALVPA